MRKKSTLQLLMLKNAYNPEGLTNEERAEACQLIGEIKCSEKLCWACEIGSKRFAINGLGLCREHALKFLGDEMVRPMLLMVPRCTTVVV